MRYTGGYIFMKILCGIPKGTISLLGGGMASPLGSRWNIARKLLGLHVYNVETSKGGGGMREGE